MSHIQQPPSYIGGTSINSACLQAPPTPLLTVSGLVVDIFDLARELDAAMQSAKSFLVGATGDPQCDQGQAPTPGDLLYRLSVVREILSSAVYNKNTVLSAIGL